MTTGATSAANEETDTPSRRAIAARFRGVLAEVDISARALARQLGVAHTWVTDRRRGEVPISIEDVLRIAPLIGVPAEALFAELVRTTGRLRAADHADIRGDKGLYRDVYHKVQPLSRGASALVRARERWGLAANQVTAYRPAG